MKKLFALGITALIISLVTPGIIQAEENNKTVTTAQFEERLKYATDIKKMYSITDNVNIRKEPSVQSEVLGKTLLNTSFEVVADINGWSMITTENGYAYIKSEYLSETCVENRWGITLTDEEKDLLSRIVMLESGNQCDLGQQAVVEVIFNRMVLEDRNRTLYDVLSEKGQFVTWKNRNSTSAIPTERVKNNVELVLSGQTNILPMNTIFFSRRKQNDNVQIIIEDHIFCNNL